MINIDYSLLHRVEIPGLDVQKGIRRLGDNPSLYFELLSKFLKTYKDSPGILTGLETAGFEEETASFVHTLKGDAGNIGASALFDILKDFEAGLKAGAQNHSGYPESPDVERELALVIESLGEIDFSFLEDKAAAIPLEVKGRDDFNRIMAELSGFLGRHQPVESLNLMDKLLNSSLPPQVLKLLKRSRELADSYNFQAALTLVNELSEASGEFFQA